MPNIYLTHPIHGSKIATMELEAEADEQNGWQRYDPEAALSSDDLPVNVSVNELEVKRRRGRPAATS